MVCSSGRSSRVPLSPQQLAKGCFSVISTCRSQKFRRRWSSLRELNCAEMHFALFEVSLKQTTSAPEASPAVKWVSTPKGPARRYVNHGRVPDHDADWQGHLVGQACAFRCLTIDCMLALQNCFIEPFAGI